MAGELQGKRALVTGASSGIGRSIAESFAREGAQVAAHGRSIEKLKETLGAIAKAGGKAFGISADMRDRPAVKRMCAEALDRLGGIDIVVNNAGVCKLMPMWETPEEVWDETLDVNLTACYLVSKATIPAMIEQKKGGRMIYISSVSGKEAEATSSAYNASKAGITLFGRCLAREVGPHGITVNSICPGWIDTKMAAELHRQMAAEQKRPYEDVFNESMRTNMLRAIQGPQDIADMAVFLAGERGKHITGQAINVCAGISII
ncbi:MAG TPA: SDR family oxidoreductase [Alphaproteobacteria bacterium]|nr:SDR family oxidoreductase [Alphaproteobacteria bacterium]